MLTVRVEEINDIIKLISEKDFCKNVFEKDGIELDISKMVISGHSFGGITAIEVAKQNKAIKAGIYMDPLLWTK